MRVDADSGLEFWKDWWQSIMVWREILVDLKRLGDRVLYMCFCEVCIVLRILDDADEGGWSVQGL